MVNGNDWIDALIRARCPGLSLEQAFYNSPEMFERDIDRVYVRHWLFAGPACRLRQRGDFFLYQVAGESILLVRGEDGRINAFYNVCRHRGSRVCREEQGHVKQLVCPYHAWTYGTDGRLLAARHLPDEIDKASFGLHACQIREVAGLFFVCLAENPPEFDQVARDIEAFFAPHVLERAKVAARTRHVVEANWKLVVENFSECYHCGPAHPELGSVMSYVRAFDSKHAAEERAALTTRWENTARRLGHRTGKLCNAEGIRHEVVRIPIREGFLTQSRGGRPVAPLMGELKEYDGGVTATQFYPFNWLVACNDYAMLPRVTPLTPAQTEIEVTWLVHESAVEGVDYHADEVIWLWNTTIEQDVRICEGNQQGVNSRRYQPGPYSKMEEPVEQFIQWYLLQVG